MQELCLKNCDQGRGWTETGESIQRGYGLGADRVQERLPPMLHASCYRGPRSRLPDWLYPSQAATNSPMTHPRDCEADAASAALAPYCPGTAARVTVIPVTQVGDQGSQTGYTPRKQQRTVQAVRTALHGTSCPVAC